MKIKALVRSRVARAFSKAKSISVKTLKAMHIFHFIKHLSLKKSNNKTKHFLDSHRLHHNWCASSSHMLPTPSPTLDHHLYYDPTCHSVVECEDDSSELSSYLDWLERRGSKKSPKHDQCNPQDDIDRLDQCNPEDDIDRRADAFIQSCHEKFRLEKEDSFRRFREMMERSL